MSTPLPPPLARLNGVMRMLLRRVDRIEDRQRWERTHLRPETGQERERRERSESSR